MNLNELILTLEDNISKKLYTLNTKIKTGEVITEDDLDIYTRNKCVENTLASILGEEKAKKFHVTAQNITFIICDKFKEKYNLRDVELFSIERIYKYNDNILDTSITEFKNVSFRLNSELDDSILWKDIDDLSEYFLKLSIQNKINKTKSNLLELESNLKTLCETHSEQSLEPIICTIDTINNELEYTIQSTLMSICELDDEIDEIDRIFI